MHSGHVLMNFKAFQEFWKAQVIISMKILES